ncbi:MAG: TAT-variant-translocated molybdopterin oxidoreductase, partial [Luteolibacter sp.]
MSKRIWHHPEVPVGETTVAWRSTGQLEDTADFRQWLDREFPQGAAELANEGEVETSRRSFMKLMGASTALAGFGMAACRRPEAYIVPYTKAPEWVIPGEATYYASAMPRAHGATPLVVTTFEGRPTKVAPNTLHPDSEGTDAFAQASVLDLYSPSRSRVILKGGQPSTRAELDALVATLAADTAVKIGFVFGADDSPTRARLTKELAAKFSAAKFYQYEALTGESASQALGDGVRMVADFAKADRIVSLDCDFVGNENHGPVTPFFDRRKPEGKSYEAKPDAASLNRLYSVEAAFTLTGGMADHRLRVSPSQVTAVAAQIARGLGVKSGVAIASPELSDPKHVAWVNGLVDDLKENAGKSAVLAGSRQSLAVHLLAHSINVALGNIGEGKPLLAVQTDLKGLGNLATLKADIDSKAVETVVCFTPSNPVYDAPADLKFAQSFVEAKTSIHFGLRTDATAHASTWHVPATHYLESWSDARSAGGTYTVVQPMILPLYDDCISELEFLLALLSADGKLLSGEGEKGAASPAYAAVRATFASVAGGEGEAAWKKLLHDGFLAKTTYAAVTPAPRSDVSAPLIATAPTKDSLEVIFATDSSVFDGRWIDNGWLQEAPDPISKLTWDNVALVAPKTAKELGIYDQIIQLETPFASRSPDDEAQNRTSPMISITVNGQTLQIPVLVSFGQAENTI